MIKVSHGGPLLKSVCADNAQNRGLAEIDDKAPLDRQTSLRPELHPGHLADAGATVQSLQLP